MIDILYYICNVFSTTRKKIFCNMGKRIYLCNANEKQQRLFKVWGFGLHAVTPCVRSLKLIE